MNFNLIQILCFWALPLGMIHAQNIDNLKKEIEKICFYDTEIDFQENDGMMISVIDGDSTYIFPFGNYNQSDSSSFQLGSISKLFSYELAESLIPNFGISITEFLELDNEYAHITVNDLVKHTSGLPKDPFFFGRIANSASNPYLDYKDEYIVPELNKYKNYYSKDSYGKFFFSHLNYALLGLILEKKVEKNFHKIVEDEFNYESLKHSDQDTMLATGYAKTGKQTSPWNFNGFAASIGLSMNIFDLTQFVKEQMNQNSKPGKAMKVQKSIYFDTPWYFVQRTKREKTYAFSGTTGTHSAFVCFDKEKKTGVVILRNSAEVLQSFALLILSMVNDSNKKRK